MNKDEMDGWLWVHTLVRTAYARTFGRSLGRSVDGYKAKMQTLDSFIHTFEFEPKITKIERVSHLHFIFIYGIETPIRSVNETNCFFKLNVFFPREDKL